MADRFDEDCELNSRGLKQRELATRRILFWSQRLLLTPLEVENMTQQELNHQLQIVKQKEKALEERRSDFERWKQLQQLRFIMYEEQRKYNQRSGAAGQASIWCILAMAQRELEDKLKIDRLRGSCQRFPSPMSLMAHDRQTGGKNQLEPLRSFLSGCPSRQDLGDGFGLESEEELELKEKKPAKVTDLQVNESVQTLIATRDKSSQTRYSYKDSFYRKPILLGSQASYNLHAKGVDPGEPLLYCPVCARKHLRVPPRY
ncbi:uncharacterized protein Dana_GF28001 [Drosophila ananassae]|uniref:Uncharacterized protein n=1 Tax=Drosophila ananassae TaxID=7217 RepID=A0A0P9AK26_DROAN|nr:uncharacterized protein LOC26515410 [Drosophila ananassae]KPU78210.1 uncharacterized protein Dana_GF28001 [Drosophila ananassae]